MLKCPRAAALAAVALSLLAGGCGPGGGTVTGTVTLDGEPLHGGVVTFHPVAGGPTATGLVDQQGGYELKVGGDQSIPPGEYFITVEATKSEPYQTQSDPPKPPPPPRRYTPDKYASKDTTDLKVTVQAGANTVPLDLTSDKPKDG